MAYGGILKEMGSHRESPEPEPFRWSDSEWLDGPMVMGRLTLFQCLRDRRNALPPTSAELAIQVADGKVASPVLVTPSGDAVLDRLLVALYDGADAPFSRPGPYTVRVVPERAGRPGSRSRPAGTTWPVDWIEGPLVAGREDRLAALAAAREASEAGSVWLRLEVFNGAVVAVVVARPSVDPTFDEAAVALFADAKLTPREAWMTRRWTAAQVSGRRRDLLPDDLSFDD